LAVAGYLRFVSGGAIREPIALRDPPKHCFDGSGLQIKAQAWYLLSTALASFAAEFPKFDFKIAPARFCASFVDKGNYIQKRIM